jgi:hypothetical protein
MESKPQRMLFADVHLWQQPEPKVPDAVGDRKVRVKPTNRAQLILRPVDVERLVEADHPVRAIWELVAQRDLTRFYDRIDCPTSSKTGRSIVRTEDGPEMTAFREKMETPEAKAVYKKRGQVAEFPHLCIKERFGLRQFSVRGLAKVKI